MLLEINNISFRYSSFDRWILRNVSFQVNEGERVGLIGPSGYGKSTLAKIIAGSIVPNEGTVLFRGKPVPRKAYSPIQLIYQHPEQAINPKWRMKEVLTECWEPDEELLKQMGIEKEWYTRWPAELSGGELQRFCIARILGPETHFLIADEMSTMLDAITQAQIWQAVIRQTEMRNMSMLIVTHDMELAKKVCTRIIDLKSINHV